MWRSSFSEDGKTREGVLYFNVEWRYNIDVKFNNIKERGYMQAAVISIIVPYPGVGIK